MKKQSITVIRQQIKNNEVTDEMIQELKADERKGVQQLLKSYEKQKAKEKQLADQFVEMSHYEQVAYSKGCQYIAGVDEAGRGPLAGPVVAAAVILPVDFTLYGLNDSKQLNQATRDYFFTKIREQAVSYGVAIIDNRTIDEMNIFEATKLAMRQAINQLKPSPDHVLIDAVELRDLPYSTESLIKGDAKSISIAAASILAKVTRDNLMREMHEEYPDYNFMSNMGYGTKHHLEKLREIGASPYHRRSYAPVRNSIS
ncbi:ribonuclease HII [Oceanobacillus profundus]|uniref:ribonuclease HII n=1 Tax=Oceanobacillus TaxID=182709 RepID=UPI0026E164E2|nr:ribonuclease HII [Oceanobacillus profundus]MDO6449657.1 ribonuclease HII [Oceanobacillus profundus]